MSTVDFDTAFERVIGHEGNYSSNPNDAGNWTGGQTGEGVLKGTKYGISAAQYPDVDIVNIKLEDAKEIYKRDFWDKIGASKLDCELVYQLFDATVNHGRGNAVRMLQRAADVADDGILGPISHSAIEDVGIHDILMLFLSERIEFMTKISTWHEFGRGWTRRIADNLVYAAEDTKES